MAGPAPAHHDAPADLAFDPPVAGRTELWNGNRERWRNLLTWDEQESVISWAWHHYPIYRERYTSAASDPAYGHLTFTRIATRADLHRLLESIR
jgi:hypothetical protein